MDTKGVIRLGKPLCEKVDLSDGEILTKYAGLWRGVGLNLGLKSFLLNNIEEENHLQRQRFEKTLDAWIKQDQDNATWSVLELAITNANRAVLGLKRLTKMPGVPSSSSVPHQPNSQYGGMEIKPEKITIPLIGPPNINTAARTVHHSVGQPIGMVAQSPSYLSQGQQPVGSQNALQLMSDPQYQFQQHLSHQQVAYPQTQPVMNHQLSAPLQQGTSHDEALVNKGKGGSYINLQLFIKVTETVCRIETRSSKGTGFIGNLLLDTINSHVLMTAYHVIPDMQTARNSKFIFSCIDGSTVTTVTVNGSDLIDEHDVPKMCPKEMEGDQRGLDYFMVKVNIDSLKDGTGQPLGIKPINLDNTVDASDDDEVSIIQYPRGGDLCFSSYVCFYTDGPLLFYECDTEEGSSGAPVIKEVNNDLKVVAVHRGKSAGEFNFGTHMSSILKHATKGILEQSSKCLPNPDELSEHLKKCKKNHLKTQANTSVLPTAPQQAGLQNMQYGMNPFYPTMPLNPAGAFLPSHHLSSQFVVPQLHQYYFQQQPQVPYQPQQPQYYFQQQPQPHQPIFTQQQLQYFQSQQPQNQAMTLHQEGYPQSQPGMIQQDHQSSKLPITLQQGTGNKPHLQDLNKYVLKIGRYWSDLGIQLLDRSVVDKLDVIKENNPRDVEKCCTEMFKFWISNSEDASWKMLVEKLRKIDLNVLAKDIENEHCK